MPPCMTQTITTASQIMESMDKFNIRAMCADGRIVKFYPRLEEVEDEQNATRSKRFYTVLLGFSNSVDGFIESVTTFNDGISGSRPTYWTTPEGDNNPIMVRLFEQLQKAENKHHTER